LPCQRRFEGKLKHAPPDLNKSRAERFMHKFATLQDG
jgi:hypothetical protein